MHPAVTVVCSGAAEAAPTPCRAYVAALGSVSYPVTVGAADAWSAWPSTVVVVPGVTVASLPANAVGRLVAFVEGGGRLVTALDTPLARALGLTFADAPVEVTGVVDAVAPSLPVKWRDAAPLRPFTAPAGARLLAWTPGRERPLVVAFRRGLGTVLFLGIELDDASTLGTSRFPYFLQAVGAAFGVAPPIASSRVVAYADLGDHRGQDPDAVAASWHRRGIREVHVGTWDAWGEKLALYGRLIAACHRRGILVYAWFELPHVTRQFWDEHPEWREKTGSGRDAHVDWRRLMALSIPECFDAVSRWMTDLLQRFDWDGADLAEVYFESPMGLARPDLFTPLNAADRELFRTRSGFDPIELFDRSSRRYFGADPASLAEFLSYRRDAIAALHERLLGVLAEVRKREPHLDVVLTLVDAMYDGQMRDRLGIDASRIVGLGSRFPFELQVEDPFTLWTLGPERYERIAGDYARLVPPGQRLAVDVNVVPRAGDVRPTSQQTGLELYRLMADARRSFPKVCLYSEASVYPQDRALLTNALASSSSVQPAGAHEVVVVSDGSVELATGRERIAAVVDGRPWPAVRGGTVLVPLGRHAVGWKRGEGPPPTLRLLEMTGVLLDAAAEEGALTVRYSSAARAYLLVPFSPSRMEVDGVPEKLTTGAGRRGFTVAAPPGEHTIRLAP